MDASDWIEKWRLGRDLRRLFRRKYRNITAPSGIDAALEESAPMRARIMEIDSGELVARAMAHGIIIADLVPLRFGSSLWREEAGHQYLSAEGKQAIGRAIQAARKERRREILEWITPITGLVGALTGLLAVFLSMD